MSQINVTAIMSRLEKTYLCAPALIDESFPMNLWRFGLVAIKVSSSSSSGPLSKVHCQSRKNYKWQEHNWVQPELISLQKKRERLYFVSKRVEVLIRKKLIEVLISNLSTLLWVLLPEDIWSASSPSSGKTSNSSVL